MLFFFYETVTGVASVHGTDASGKSWDIRYEGFNLVDAWMAANADGFYLAPGETFSFFDPTPVVRPLV